jgi:hypothetical protein
MKQDAANSCRSTLIVTTIYVAMTLGVLMGGILQPMLLVVGGILAFLGVYCYFFWSAVAYDLTDRTLTVFFRASKKTFPVVTRCSRIHDRFSIWTALRLCGNGGVFGGSGIFWNRRYGVFRAYVTRNQPSDLVLIETKQRRIIISPIDPKNFIEPLTPSLS